MFSVVGFYDIGGTYLQTTRRHIPEHSYLHNHNHERLQYHRSAIVLKVGNSMEFRCENKISHRDFCFAKPLEIPRRWKDNIKTDLRVACFGFGLRTVPIGSSAGVATDYGLDGPGIESRWGEISARPDRPWGPPDLLYNGYRVFLGGKVRPGCAADHSPYSSAAAMEEYSYTSTHPLGHNRACNGDTLTYRVH